MLFEFFQGENKKIRFFNEKSLQKVWWVNKMDFGRKVQLLRKSHDLSQENLASILKINRNYLYRR